MYSLLIPFFKSHFEFLDSPFLCPYLSLSLLICVHLVFYQSHCLSTLSSSSSVSPTVSLFLPICWFVCLSERNLVLHSFPVFFSLNWLPHRWQWKELLEKPQKRIDLTTMDLLFLLKHYNRAESDETCSYFLVMLKFLFHHAVTSMTCTNSWHWYSSSFFQFIYDGCPRIDKTMFTYQNLLHVF